MGLVVVGLAILGPASLFLSSFARIGYEDSWTPLSTRILDGNSFYFVLWMDEYNSSYRVYRCNSTDLFCDQIAIVAPCRCYRSTLVNRDDAQMVVDQVAQTISVIIKGSQTYSFQAK